MNSKSIVIERGHPTQLLQDAINYAKLNHAHFDVNLTAKTEGKT